MDFTFGSDPEFILCDGEGRPKSAIGVLGSGREKRIRVGDDFFFYDNVLAECTVHPASTGDEAVENVGRSLKTLASLVAPYSLTTLPVADYDEMEMLHEDARKSGCSPEFCAYGLKSVSPARVNRIFRESNTRTAGGHVHIGTSMGGSHEDCVMFVRMLDLFLGVAAIALDSDPSSRRRRKIYGAPGRYRQPKHGVEYRTPGNFWLSSPKLVSLMFDICAEVGSLTEAGIHNRFWSVDKERLESDDFWNECGDPSECHRCHGYDLGLLRRMFRLGRNDALRSGSEIVSLVCRHLSGNVKNRIAKFARVNFDIRKEWGI